MINLHESDWKLSKIDALVQEGVFNSRTEAFRTGALLMITMDNVQQLSKLDKLDSNLFGKEISLCVNALKNKKFDMVYDNLIQISSALSLRATISPLLDISDDKESFQHTASVIKKYAGVIKKISTYDPKTQQRIADDLKRDLSAIRAYLQSNEDNISNTKYEQLEKKPEITKPTKQERRTLLSEAARTWKARRTLQRKIGITKTYVEYPKKLITYKKPTRKLQEIYIRA